MPDDYLETKGELSGELNPKKKKKRKHWWQIAIDAVLVCLLLAVAGVSANVIYLTSNYGDAFFVDGVSMYPTLNKGALRKETDGTYTKVTWRSGEQKAGDLVDYGWARMGERGLSDLKRFDIVITYYEKDYQVDAAGTKTLKSDASLKIKRLIAFPGETVQISPDYDDSGNLSTPWGTLTITSGSGKVSVYPSFYSFDDFEDIAIGSSIITYRSKLTEANVTFGPYTLAADSYFVLGDNRASNFSSDSRNLENQVTSNCLQGKAYLITSLRELKTNAKGNLEPVFKLSKVRPFWNYVHLDGQAIEKTKIEDASHA